MSINNQKAQRWMQRRQNRKQASPPAYQNPAHGHGPMPPHLPQAPNWNFPPQQGPLGPASPQDLPFYLQRPMGHGPMGPIHPLDQIGMYTNERDIYGVGPHQLERLYSMQEEPDVPQWMWR